MNVVLENRTARLTILIDPRKKALFERLKKVAVQVPQPEIHIRADQNTRYESVGRVVATCQRAAIVKIGFITEPPARSLAGG